MKKYLFTLFMITGVLFISCKNESGLSATAQKNKEVNDAIMKAYEAGDFSKMGDYISADAVDHSGEMGDIKGLDSIVSEMKRYREMVTDMKTNTIQEIATDDFVYTWADGTYTMQGQPTSMSSMDITKFKDGKAIEHWVYMDPKDVVKMMQMQMPTDTAAVVKMDTLQKK